jgi:hypothetical protein
MAPAMNLDWHADRSDLPELVLLDQLGVGEPIDLGAVRGYRLGRVREQMAAHRLDACVLLDPVNIRYATGAQNMQVFHSRNPARYLFVAQSGPVILHEFAGCAHLAEGLETIDEIRPAITPATSPPETRSRPSSGPGRTGHRARARALRAASSGRGRAGQFGGGAGARRAGPSPRRRAGVP